MYKVIQTTYISLFSFHFFLSVMLYNSVRQSKCRRTIDTQLIQDKGQHLVILYILNKWGGCKYNICNMTNDFVFLFTKLFQTLQHMTNSFRSPMQRSDR